VVQRAKDLLARKQHKFKIHIVTMSKDDAKEISDKLNNEGVSSMWLTSHQIQSEKEEIMKNWEERDEIAIVTTFTDGIDNALTEDVIIVRARYSVTSLMQALGRIRPARQQQDTATLHIFDTGYDPTNEAQDQDTINYMRAAQLIPAGEEKKAEVWYYNLFHIRGYRKLVDSDGCYRKKLLLSCGIESRNCGFCSSCKSQPLFAAATHANESVQNEHEERRYVIAMLEEMKSKCIVCSDNACDGRQCLPKTLADGRNIQDRVSNSCHKCFQFCPGNNYHVTTKCHAYFGIEPGKTQSSINRACPFCLLAFDKDIPADTAMNFHNQPGRCLYKARIRRVLLYHVCQKSDFGESARGVLLPCITNPSIWYKTMYKNLGDIMVEHEMMDNTEVE
jgi:hypothetical protein